MDIHINLSGNLEQINDINLVIRIQDNIANTNCNFVDAHIVSNGQQTLQPIKSSLQLMKPKLYKLILYNHQHVQREMAQVMQWR